MFAAFCLLHSHGDGDDPETGNGKTAPFRRGFETHYLENYRTNCSSIQIRKSARSCLSVVLLIGFVVVVVALNTTLYPFPSFHIPNESNLQ